MYSLLSLGITNISCAIAEGCSDVVIYEHSGCGYIKVQNALLNITKFIQSFCHLSTLTNFKENVLFKIFSMNRWKMMHFFVCCLHIMLRSCRSSRSNCEYQVARCVEK